MLYRLDPAKPEDHILLNAVERTPGIGDGHRLLLKNRLNVEPAADGQSKVKQK